MAIAFVAAGTWTAGTTSIAPPLPSGMQAGDLMLLAIHTCNQAVSAITGWTQATTSPVSTGTANAAGGTRITVYYRWWQSGDGAPTVAVTGGTVTNARIFGYRGVDPTTPFDGVTPVATTLATANATLTLTGLTTATPNAMLFFAVARDQDLNATTAVTAFTNANLTGIAERNDQVVNTGVGGGLWVGEGFKDTAGATGNLTITQTSSIAVGITFALRPLRSGSLAVTESGADTFAGAGDVIVKGALAVSETGADTFAATGKVIVAGSLAVSESSADTFAASGSVSDASITGTLAASETGADSIAATGKVIVKGSLAVSESGSDAFAGTGKVLVAGSLLASESGADAFAATGKVIVKGSLAASESAADAFAASGAVSWGPPISGSLSATESGSDSFTASGSVAWQPVSGALAASESGADALAAAGKVIVKGSLAASESADSLAAAAPSAGGRRSTAAWPHPKPAPTASRRPAPSPGAPASAATSRRSSCPMSLSPSAACASSAP